MGQGLYRSCRDHGGGKLSSTLKITNPEIGKFNIWAGPGVNGVGLEQAEGFIINWKAGVVPQPQPEVEHYQVSFADGPDLSHSAETFQLCHAGKMMIVMLGHEECEVDEAHRRPKTRVFRRTLEEGLFCSIQLAHQSSTVDTERS
jgi:hypothetical protein